MLVDVADDVDDLAPPAVVAVRLLHEDQRDLEVLGDPPRGVRVAEVRHDERDALGIRLDDPAEVLDQQVARGELVPGDREEPLDLHLVHVHREEAVRAGDTDDVGQQAGRDRHARLVLLVASAVRVVRHDRGDAAGRRALEGVEHDQQLHDRVADRGSDEGLHDEDVVLPRVLLDLHEDVVVGEFEDVDRPDRDLQVSTDVSGELGVGVSGVDREASEHGSPPAADRRWSCSKSIRALACES